MKDAELRRLVEEVLGDIAPEADVASVGGGEDIRQALDLDSMDFLNLVIGLHKRTGVDVPEADYAKLFTLDGMAAYLP
ncbi:MAG: acyl carrier protein [Porticoccaceae bacterium]